MVNTRDNKIYIGWMRSFDVYTNIVLEGSMSYYILFNNYFFDVVAMERIIVKDKYADIPVGLIVLRGDAISTVSSKQSDEEIGKVLHKVPLEEIIEEYHVCNLIYNFI